MVLGQSPVLIEFAIALPVVLLVAWLIALVLRWIFGARLSLSLSVMTVIAVLGIAVGMFLTGLLTSGLGLWMPTTLIFSLGASLGLSLLVASVVAALRRDSGAVDVAAVLAAGESDRVEFKETARWNVRDDKKDARMETAIVKTVAALLNSRGGMLVIGANDEGQAIGLERDLATLRVPDYDRFELWLRDLFGSNLGKNTAALPHITFAPAPSGVQVCIVRCRPATKPVFLKQGNATDLWVRVGNSSRSLGVDEAVDYVARHWRTTPMSFLLGRPTG